MSNSNLKPIHLFTHGLGPNAWKITILFEELGIPYTEEFAEMEKLHTPYYEKHNPNGRVPIIVDPNTDLTLYESGAIIKYIIDKYDHDKKLTIATEPDKYLLDQYLFFQVGQGPYFGQITWFYFFHPEAVQSAKDRYVNELKRVTKVLDGILKDREYLVGSKCTYADLAWVPWYWLLPGLEPVLPGLEAEIKQDNPNWARWVERLNERPAVKKCSEKRAARIQVEMAPKS